MIKICNVVDVFAVNCYFCIDDKTRHGFLIDHDTILYSGHTEPTTVGQEKSLYYNF